MQMQYWAAVIRLECRPFSGEKVFDAHLSKFQTLVDLAKRFTRKLHCSESIGAASCIGFDTNYLPVLSFVALRCRDPRTRREAISTLRAHPRIEGQWDNRVAADVSEYIMILEENSGTVPEPSSCDEIPDISRLHLLSCSFFSYNKFKQRHEMSVPGYDSRVISLIWAIAVITYGIQNSSSVD